MIKNLLLIALACCLYSFGCGTDRYASKRDIPNIVQSQLASIKFDSSFNVISPLAGYANTDGSNDTYFFNVRLKDSVLKGQLVRKTTQNGYTGIAQRFKIQFLLINMCCNCRHNPIHCAYSRQGMIDTTAKYHCSGWGANVAEYSSSN